MFGLSFLNTLFLWGLAAASLPLIIHLIKRNRAVKLPFAAMRFLQLEPHQRVRSQRLKQILLLLMRISALAILALAFARPFFKNAGTTSLWHNQPQSAVILVDNSLSMTYENNFQLAVEKAKELLGSFVPGDQVAVMQFSESVEIVANANKDFKTLSNLLNDRLKPSSSSTNYLRGIQAAEALLMESPFQKKSIFLISDFQKSGWDLVYPNFKIQSGIRLYFNPISKEDFSNLAVTEVKILKSAKRVRRGDILVRVKNYGNEKSKNKIALYLNNKKIGEKQATIPKRGEKIVEFNRIAFPNATTVGLVEVNSAKDKLTLDNQYYFVLEKKSKALILAVNGEPNRRDAPKDELFFVERAINLPNSQNYKLVKAKPKDLNKYDLSEYRVVLLANVKDISRETLKRLIFYVRGGGGLFIALGDQVSPTIFNRLFRDLTPATLTNLAFDYLNRESGSILAEVDYQHPIFRLFSEPSHGDPSTAQFYQYFHAKPMSSEAVLARFDDGSPAMLERRVGKGKVVLFTSSLDAEWNNLPVKAIFLPMLYQIIHYAAAVTKGEKSYLVGQPVPINSVRGNSSSTEKLFVRTPSGEEIEVQSNMFDQADEPGIYQIHRSSQRLAAAYFAVNVDSKESDLTPADLQELKQRYVDGSEEMEQIASFSSTDMSDQLEGRQRLWRFAILGVILILVGETWLANRTYR
jgi:3-isopropylmalate dehydratase small subunit